MIPDAQSYLSHVPVVVLSKAEADKKSKYCSAATTCHAHFTPLCFSVDGLAVSEASCFLKRLAYGLSHRWEKNYPEVMFWIRANLAFALVRATGLCIRGTRTKWRHLGFEDGAIIDEWTTVVKFTYVYVFLFVFQLSLFCCVFVLFTFPLFFFFYC